MDGDMQAKYMQFQMLENHLKALEKERVILIGKIEELYATIKTLEEVKNLKNGDELMISLGSGSFIPGKLGDNSKILLSLGAGIVIKKAIPDAVEILNERIEEMKKSEKELELELRNVSEQLNKLVPELEEASKKIKQ